MTSRSRWRGLRRVITVALLGLAVVPLMSTSASAASIGDSYNPDPLSALQSWAIYGGVIGGGFLIALALTVLTSRSSDPPRYRPGRPWDHDEVWIGDRPQVAGDERPRVALPGAGGASGRW